jgi:hypothetical protein
MNADGRAANMAESPPGLFEQHQQYLRDRAVDADVGAERGYRTVSDKAELKRRGFSPAQQELTPALLIPVWSVRGEVESFQIRPDCPRSNPKGKPRKFETRARDRLVLDVHPRLARRNGKPPLIADPSIPLVITEGPVKADSGLSIGLCVIALTGGLPWEK